MPFTHALELWATNAHELALEDRDNLGTAPASVVVRLAGEAQLRRCPWGCRGDECLCCLFKALRNKRETVDVVGQEECRCRCNLLGPSRVWNARLKSA